MRHILSEISTKFKLRIRHVLKRFVKRAPGFYVTRPFDSKLTILLFLEKWDDDK